MGRLVFILLSVVLCAQLQGCSHLASLLSNHLTGSENKPLLHVDSHVGDKKYAAQDNDINTQSNHGTIAGRDHVLIREAKAVTLVSVSWYNVVQMILIIILTILVTFAYAVPISKFFRKRFYNKR